MVIKWLYNANIRLLFLSRQERQNYYSYAHFYRFIVRINTNKYANMLQIVTPEKSNNEFRVMIGEGSLFYYNINSKPKLTLKY